MANNGKNTELVLLIRNTNPRMEDTVDRGPYIGSLDAFDHFCSELAWALYPSGSVYRMHMPPREPETGGGWGEQEIPVSVLSGAGAAAFTALYQVIKAHLTKDKDRELMLERSDDIKRITIRGHSLPEEKELIRELFPEAL